jgi:hypothetical protein
MIRTAAAGASLLRRRDGPVTVPGSAGEGMKPIWPAIREFMTNAARAA